MDRLPGGRAGSPIGVPERCRSVAGQEGSIQARRGVIGRPRILSGHDLYGTVQGLNPEVGVETVALLDLGAEGAQRLAELGGLEGRVRLDLLAIGQDGGAAVAMAEADDTLDLMQLDRDREIVPPDLLPG